MKRRYILAGAIAATVLAGGVGLDAALSGHGGPSSAVYGAAPAAATGIGVATLAPGTALVDGTGHALYLFEADAGTTSTCTGPCAQVWPPLVTHGTPSLVSGAVQARLFGTAPRADGTQQLTYNGHPLYSFAGDKAPGEARGQGLDQFGAAWFVVTPAGDKIDSKRSPETSPAPAPVPPAPARSASGYGY
ncbi:COG4315 family predicted lipoprotein [Pseudonocardia sp. T1-2H]|uniref:COG4315 family predicted lipoprotein n=1 Tax=Pseudonocardia sp. T1-2H TaxID=3128899 RepID=UPI0031014FEA